MPRPPAPPHVPQARPAPVRAAHVQRAVAPPTSRPPLKGTVQPSVAPAAASRPVAAHVRAALGGGAQPAAAPAGRLPAPHVQAAAGRPIIQPHAAPPRPVTPVRPAATPRPGVPVPGGTIQPAWGLGALAGGLASAGLYALSFSNPVTALGGIGVGLVTHFLTEPAAPVVAHVVAPVIAAPMAAPVFNLTGNGIGDLVLSKSARIQGAIGNGAGWEIWLQIELASWLRNRGCQVARETPYGDGQSLDILATKDGTTVAIEIKVESATNAVVGFIPAVRADVQKIQGYNATPVDERLVLAVCYGAYARRTLAEFGTDMGVTYQTDGAIGVAVVFADNF